MQRPAMLPNWPRGLPARLFMGLAVLALGAAACGPEVPTLVIALPTLAPVRIQSATSTPLATGPAATRAALHLPTEAPTLAPANAAASPAPTSLEPTPDGQSLNRQVALPILMYHYVEPWPADAGTLRKNLTVQP